MLLDENGNMLDFFNDFENGRLGIRDIGFIYLLDLLIDEGYNLEYRIVKICFAKASIYKKRISKMIREGYMAIICVGPHGQDYPETFSTGGHYIAITGIDKKNGEFYVANSNRIGDTQNNVTFSYEVIIENMYSNTFDFLMIKKI